MKKWLPVLSILILILAWWSIQRKGAGIPPAPSIEAARPRPINPVVANISRSPAAAPKKKSDYDSTLPANERESLESMGATLSQAELPAFSLYRLLDQLKRTGQQPIVIKDSNPDTGEMTVVRTKSPLPGTRYFHAQYFTSEDGERFVQHMSFEFKPGPQSMAAAIATVERNFPNLSRPKAQREDYVQWDWNDKYIVWVKRMGAGDLQDDPFNSYSASDVGTIRVAVELEIHGE